MNGIRYSVHSFRTIERNSSFRSIVPNEWTVFVISSIRSEQMNEKRYFVYSFGTNERKSLFCSFVPNEWTGFVIPFIRSERINGDRYFVYSFGTNERNSLFVLVVGNEKRIPSFVLCTRARTKFVLRPERNSFRGRNGIRSTRRTNFVPQTSRGTEFVLHS